MTDMTDMKYRNPQYTADGRIDMEINHSRFGWIPFTADPNDSEKHGRDLFERAKSEAAAYEPPPPQPESVPQSVTRFQARRALKDAGLFDQVGTAVQNADEFVQDAWAEAQDFKRHSLTIDAIAGELGLSDAQIDDLFRAAAKIEA